MREAAVRASHALVHEGRVWLIDPVDEPEAMERVAALGEPAAVVQLFVAHNRDSEAIAKRLGVPFHKLPEVLPDSPFSVLKLDLGLWKERALWWPEPRGLIVPESIGTGPAYAVGRGPAGVHPFRRAAAAVLAEVLPARAPARRPRPAAPRRRRRRGAARRAQPCAT